MTTDPATNPPPPAWLTSWCRDHLGSEPIDLLLTAAHLSEVYGVRLADGTAAVVKSRPDPTGRTGTCVAAQLAAAEAGFACARPLTGVVRTGDRAVHAEEWRPGGETRHGDDAPMAEHYGRLYAELTAITATLDKLAPPLPNPPWVVWNSGAPGFWPPNPDHDERLAEVDLPEQLLRIAARVGDRLAAADPLPRILGHADWEPHNITWTPEGGVHTVHDWDSIAWHPEPVLVGLASGAFASHGQPTLARIDSSEAFIDAFEDARGASFGADERELAWAASLVTPLHNARAELLWGWPRVSLARLLEQGGERLRLAGA